MAAKRELAHLEPRPKKTWLAQLKRRFPSADPSVVTTVLQLINVGRGITAKVSPHFQAVGLTEARFTVVMMIYRLEWESQVATPSGLAAQARVGRAAMTQLLDGLAEVGWIERRTHPDDRRKLAITLSEEGRRRLERLLPDHYARLGKIMKKLTKEEREVLRGLLGKVTSGLAGLDE